MKVVSAQIVMAKYEETTKGNPHQLTKKQHLLSFKLISNFVNENGCIEVQREGTNHIFNATPADRIFCTMRTWDQRAEHGWMKTIEDEFFSEVIENSFSKKSRKYHRIITRYFLLWCVRSEYSKIEITDAKLKGISPSAENLTKYEEEVIERKGGIFVDFEEKIKSRFMISIQSQFRHSELCRRYIGTKWGKLESEEKPFVFSKFVTPYWYVPVSPALIFCAGHKDMKITRESVFNFNRQIFNSHHGCIASNNLSQALER